MNRIITSELLSSAYSYESYKSLTSKLISENKTTGNSQSEKNIYFTKLNFQRIKRIEKTAVISDDLKKEILKLNHSLVFLFIAEAWCGDVAQNLPVIKKITELNPIIKLKIILRDENEAVMNKFLTNGTRAIPVCLIVDDINYDVIGKWGPRPAPAQQMVIENKRTNLFSHDVLAKNIQLWYAKDKTYSIQNEFLNLLRIINSD